MRRFCKHCAGPSIVWWGCYWGVDQQKSGALHGPLATVNVVTSNVITVPTIHGLGGRHSADNTATSGGARPPYPPAARRRRGRRRLYSPGAPEATTVTAVAEASQPPSMVPRRRGPGAPTPPPMFTPAAVALRGRRSRGGGPRIPTQQQASQPPRGVANLTARERPGRSATTEDRATAVAQWNRSASPWLRAP